jgi:flagellar operon protein
LNVAIETLKQQPISPRATVTDGSVTKNRVAGFDPATALDFRAALDQVVGGNTAAGLGAGAAANAAGATAAQALKFSSHAIERMRSRGISFSPEMMKNIEGAVQRAAQKGSKDTLVLAGDNALIVSVKNNTVITVMDRASMRENVFTNIDSTVVL